MSVSLEAAPIPANRRALLDAAPNPANRRAVTIRPFCAGDVVQLALQPSQHMTLGIHRPVHDLDDGRELEKCGPAWTVVGCGRADPTSPTEPARPRVLACYGFQELWPAEGSFGGHALAWALLGEALGSAHVAITRFAIRTIAESPYSRIEAIVRAGVAGEVQWARMVGFRHVAELRRWGPAGEDHILFERVR